MACDNETRSLISNTDTRAAVTAKLNTMRADLDAAVLNWLPDNCAESVIHNGIIWELKDAASDPSVEPSLTAPGSDNWVSVTDPGANAAAQATNTKQFGLTATAGQNAFTLPEAPVSTAAMLVFVNGQKQSNGVDYTITGQNFNWVSPNFPLSNDDELTFYGDFT